MLTVFNRSSTRSEGPPWETPITRTLLGALIILLVMAAPTIGASAVSGPVSFTADNQTISGLTIIMPTGSTVAAVTLRGHKGCRLLNCLIKHQLGYGVDVSGSDDYVIERCNIICSAAPAKGQNPNSNMNNINIYASARGWIDNVRLENGSTGIYMLDCSQGPVITHIEGHNMRGPFPRGQLIQPNKSPNGSLMDFSMINDRNIAWTEDCINIYGSDGWTVAEGLIDGNNSPSGDNIIFEDCNSGHVDHVDAINFGNGAFSVNNSHNIIFTNCRADGVSLVGWQGRKPPLSKGLIFAALGSSGNITYASTCIWGPKAGGNLTYVRSLMNFGATGPVSFRPRPPVVLEPASSSRHHAGAP